MSLHFKITQEGTNSLFKKFYQTYIEDAFDAKEKDI